MLAALVAAPSLAAAPARRLALWLDGRGALALQPTIATAAADHRLVAAHLVARELRHVRGKSAGARAAALAARLHAPVLYARSDAGEVALVFATPDGATAERTSPPGKSTVAVAVRELLHGNAPAPSPVAQAAPAAPATRAPSPVSPAPATRAPSSSSSTAHAAQPPSSPAHAAQPPPSSAAPATVAPAAVSDEPDNAVVRVVPPPFAEPLFSVALDGGVGARRLQYNQPVTSNLPSYSVGAVPWMGFRAELHPFARTTLPFLRGLGAFGRFGHSLYQQSVVAGGGPRVSASWLGYDVGLHERLRTGRHRFSPVVGVAFAYGRVAYDFEDAGQLISETPSVDYRYLRPALDARLPLGRVVLFADAGYRAVLAAGYVGSRFPHAQVGGIDAGAGLAIELPRDVELRLAGQYVRFFYDFRPQPGDPYVAGGAVDEFVVGELALAYGF